VKKRLFTAAAGDPKKLGALVAARLALAPAEAAARVAAGAVHVDGRRADDPEQPIAPGARVIVFAPAPATETPAPTVAWRDGWILIADKPPGLPSQATRADAAHALDAWARTVAPEARLMHRLDRDASGLVLFAARAWACAPLQAALSDGRIERRYLAVVAGRLGAVGESGRIELRVGRHPHDARLRVAADA
jgi:23S rRNA-/tRNA-specific pseudouridylate synthase